MLTGARVFGSFFLFIMRSFGHDLILFHWFCVCLRSFYLFPGLCVLFFFLHPLSYAVGCGR